MLATAGAVRSMYLSVWAARAGHGVGRAGEVARQTRRASRRNRERAVSFVGARDARLLRVAIRLPNLSLQYASATAMSGIQKDCKTPRDALT